MPIYKRFYKSLYAPKYIAAFRLLGIGKTIQYIFVLAFILCLPAFLTALIYAITGDLPARIKLPFLLENKKLVQQNNFIYIPIALLFYYILLSFSLFLKAVIFAGIGLLIASILKKRTEYRHLFRMSVHALTLPVLLTVLLEWTGWTFNYAYAADWLLVTIMLYLSVRCLPRTMK